MKPSKKQTILWILLEMVFLVVFNTVFFVVGGTKHPASVWVSYAFIHFAYIMSVISPLLVPRTKSAVIFGRTLDMISSWYFFAEFAVGLFCILVRFDSVKGPLVVQVVIAGAYAIILLINMLANEHTADAEKKQKVEENFVKDTASRVKLLKDAVSGRKASKAVERVYDQLHASPTQSAPEVAGLEAQISARISELENAVRAGEDSKVVKHCDELSRMIEERTRKVRLTY